MDNLVKTDVTVEAKCHEILLSYIVGIVQELEIRNIIDSCSSRCNNIALMKEDNQYLLDG